MLPHLILSDPGSEPFLLEELRRAFGGAEHAVLGPGLVGTNIVVEHERPPCLVFARQFLPGASVADAKSIRTWSEQLLEMAGTCLPENEPWALHVVPHYGGERAGMNRCELITQTFRDLLQRKRRSLLRQLEKACRPFTSRHSILQLLLTSPETGFLSTALAPLPYQLRVLISPFPKGEIEPARDKEPPSRAFAKLVEAELRMGCGIGSGETCVDLGASPGSWTYVALHRGARVIAVDRAPLREDLMAHARLKFAKGDAFNYVPEAPVDWLLCDVIAAPQRSIDLLIRWVRNGWAHRFVATIKFKGQSEYHALEQLKHALPPLCDEFYLTRLSANKNEACAFGVRTPSPSRI
jgi:23S rRNA (cytidine2498-2'-O)-methyltransferase